MNEEQLIDRIAQMWVDNGGDVDGFDYCYKAISNKINEIRNRHSEL